MPDPQITIFLTPPDAELFKSYQEFHQTFALLCKSGVFDIKSGSATIHFDNLGVIQKVERHDVILDKRVKTMS